MMPSTSLTAGKLDATCCKEVRGDARHRFHMPLQRLWRVCLWRVLFGLVLASMLPPPAYANDETAAAEYRVKAAYLFKFALYVEWPDSAYPSPAAPLVMGVAGNEELASALEGLMQGRTANGRAIVVKRIEAYTSLNGLQVLFIGKSEMPKWKRWQAQIDTPPVLIVTEADGAMAQGSMINFLWVDSHIRFEIGLGAAEKSGLKLSSRLLAVAQHVKTEAP